MRTKRLLAFLTAAVMMVSTLAGCSGSSGSSGKGSEDGAFTLRISTTGIQDDGLDIAMEIFKRDYPQAEFEIITSPWAESRDKQLTMCSMEDYPDIGKMGIWHKEFYRDGLVIDLKPIIKDWEIMDHLTEGQLGRMEIDGAYSGITYNNNTNLMFYNKDILDELGVEPPQTFDDLAALGEKIKTSGIKSANGNQVFATCVPSSTWDIGSWFFSNGGEFMNEDNSQTIIDSPESVAAHTLMQDFVKNGYSPVPDGTADQLWLNGQLAVYLGGEWNLDATRDAGINYGVMPIVAGSTGKGYSSLGGGEWAIFENAPNKDMAIEFLKVLYSEEYQIRADRGVTDITIYDNEEKKAEWEKNGMLEVKVIQQQQLQNTKFNFMENCFTYPEGAEIYTAAVQRILINMEDPQTVLSEAAAQINAGLSAS